MQKRTTWMWQVWRWVKQKTSSSVWMSRLQVFSSKRWKGLLTKMQPSASFKPRHLSQQTFTAHRWWSLPSHNTKEKSSHQRLTGECVQCLLLTCTWELTTFTLTLTTLKRSAIPMCYPRIFSRDSSVYLTCEPKLQASCMESVQQRILKSKRSELLS